MSPRLATILAIVKERGWVCPAEVAEQLGSDHKQAAKDLCKLVDKGLIARVRHGLYSSDDDGALRRRVLLSKLQELSA